MKNIFQLFILLLLMPFQLCNANIFYFFRHPTLLVANTASLQDIANWTKQVHQNNNFASSVNHLNNSYLITPAAPTLNYDIKKNRLSSPETHIITVQKDPSNEQAIELTCSCLAFCKAKKLSGPITSFSLIQYTYEKNKKTSKKKRYAPLKPAAYLAIKTPCTIHLENLKQENNHFTFQSRHKDSVINPSYLHGLIALEKIVKNNSQSIYKLCEQNAQTSYVTKRDVTHFFCSNQHTRDLKKSFNIDRKKAQLITASSFVIGVGLLALVYRYKNNDFP